MNDSILDSIKILLGVDPTYEYFDSTIIMHINSAFGTLWQLGVGTADCYSISDNTNIWSEFTDSSSLLNLVKPYIAKRVRLNWDTPTSATVLEALKSEIAQDEWRIGIMENKNQEE